MFHGLDPDEEIEPAPAALKREPAGAVQDSSEGQGVPAGMVAVSKQQTDKKRRSLPAVSRQVVRDTSRAQKGRNCSPISDM